MRISCIHPPFLCGSTLLLLVLCINAGCSERTYQPQPNNAITDGTRPETTTASTSQTATASTTPSTTSSTSLTTSAACGEYNLGEMWESGDGCNTCTCTDQGAVCTNNDCYPESCDIHANALIDAIWQNNTCTQDDDCILLKTSCDLPTQTCHSSLRADANLAAYDAAIRGWDENGCSQGCDGLCNSGGVRGLCLGGRCGVGPIPSPCAEFDARLGDVWRVGECTECTCTESGPSCVELACDGPRSCGPYAHGETTPEINCGNCGCDDGLLSCDDAECPEPEPDPSLCTFLEDNYARTAARSACTRDSDCHVLHGLCGVGLGGCYEVTHVTVQQFELNLFSRHYRNNTCTRGVCDCGEPPKAICVQGQCTAQ